jgi:hypothetical protein
MKHIGIKWHHFKDQVKKGMVWMMKVDMNFNWAEPLNHQKHENLQKLLMGW